MTTASTRPRGRRPGHDDTRGTIRRAALELFGSQGYDGVSLRAIAREAQVDPALVHHYFRSKADLYSQAVLATDIDVEELVARILDGAAAGIGRRTVSAFFALWDSPAGREQYLAHLVESVESGGGSLDEFLAREVFSRVAASQGHSNAALRGQLAATALLGVMMGRHVVRLPVVSGVTLRVLGKPLAATLQHYLVEPW